MYTQAYVAAKVDHAVLKAETTTKQILHEADMCAGRGVGCLCVRPTDVACVSKRLQGTSCRPCMVVGFPLGCNQPEIKADEARQGIEDGAVELDMVMNVGRFLSADNDFVRDDISAVVNVARPHDIIVKVILETPLLTLAQVADACRLAEAGGADFVKTASGYSGGGATPEAVDVMLKTVGKTMKVKASGGIKTWQEAVAYLEKGCSRLGLSGTEAILDGAQADDGY